MHKKTGHKKNKKGEKEIATKEVGEYNDFVIIEKEEKKEKKYDLKDLLFFKDWIILEKNDKQKKSRFSDLFKEIEESSKNQNNEVKENAKEDKKEDAKENVKENAKEEIKEEDKKNLSNITNSQISQITYQSTSFDSKTNSSISDSLENSSINQIIENKKIENNSINQIKEKKKIDKNKLEDPKENIEEANLNVDVNKIISLEDKRNTIMIKNIPNKFNKDLLLMYINHNFKGTYDLFILPTDINKYKNFGYAFINFTSSYYIPYFYFMFNGKMWSNTNSRKVCELTYSKVQGRENLLKHYPSKITYANEEAYNVTPEQKYIIPNVYKLVFNKFFPKQKIEEYKYYFITKMPDEK